MTVAATSATAQAAVRRKTRFFLALAVGILAFVVVGFARTFYLRPLFGAVDGPTGSTQVPPHLMLHGIVMTAWFVFVVMQSLLIQRGNVALHRRAGVFGVVLACLVIAVGLYIDHEFLARRITAGIPIGPRQQGVFVGDTIVLLLYFPTLVAAGVFFRRSFETHKRLMLMSSIVMLGPVVVRYAALLPVVGLPNVLLIILSPIPLILALLAYDIATRRRPHWVTILGGALVVLYAPLRDGLVETEAAQAYFESMRDAV